MEVKKRIKQLKLEKTNHKYSNIASKLNWKNNPKLGVDYWQKQLNKKLYYDVACFGILVFSEFRKKKYGQLMIMSFSKILSDIFSETTA